MRLPCRERIPIYYVFLAAGFAWFFAWNAAVLLRPASDAVERGRSGGTEVQLATDALVGDAGNETCPSAATAAIPDVAPDPLAEDGYPDSEWTAADSEEYELLRTLLRNATLAFGFDEPALYGNITGQTPGKAASADDLESFLCRGSDFEGGRHADSEFGAWINYASHERTLRQTLFREVMKENADIDLFRVVGNELSVRNCFKCTRGVQAGPKYLPLLQRIIDMANASGIALPDVRILFECVDGASSLAPTYPITVASKAAGLKDILLPNFNFVIDLGRKRDANTWVGTEPWEKRQAKAVWRGGMTGYDFGPNGIVPLQQIRVSVLHQGSTYPDLVDASCDLADPGMAVDIFSDEMKQHILHKYCRNSSFISLEDQANRFRYAVNVDGFAAAFRFFMVLSSGMTPMLPSDNVYREHYYALLKPWVHFVPSASWRLHEAVSFLRRRDGLARRIALRAMRFAARNLTLRPTLCYILQIWRRLAELQEGLDWEAIEEAYAEALAARGGMPVVGNWTGGKQRPFVPYAVWSQHVGGSK
ncbi:glycosyl transferase family 90-domain-containing protein [Hyaloraphidium curvatum]|nr:glycosyl transferase family 90-domain-containing protein [Hyaloraphidium curvatum]